MKKKIVVSILGILLVTIVSAGLISFLSNIITGTVTVEGSVFYLDDSESLLLNQLPDNSDNLFVVDVDIFESTSLGIDEFYKSEFDVKICVKTDWDNVGDKPSFSFTISNDDGEICTTETETTSATSSCSNRELSCSSTDVIDMSGDQKFILTFNGDSGITYEIRKDDSDETKSAKIELSKAT